MVWVGISRVWPVGWIQCLSSPSSAWTALSVPQGAQQKNPTTVSRDLRGQPYLCGTPGVMLAGAANPGSGSPWRPLGTEVEVLHNIPSRMESAVCTRDTFPLLFPHFSPGTLSPLFSSLETTWSENWRCSNSFLYSSNSSMPHWCAANVGSSVAGIWGRGIYV